MKTYICTCDKLINETMQMVDHFFPKYWPESDVIVLGYKNPSCDYKFAKFISLGKDTGSKDHCQQLFNYFSNIEDKHFIIGVDDQPLVSKVNQDIIDYLENIFKLKSDIGRCSLTLSNARRSNTTIDNMDINKENIRLFENHEGVPYKLSIVYSIFNKEYFLKYLEESKNLWDWEINGSKKSINDGWRIIGTEPAPLDYTHLYKGGELRFDWNHSTENAQPKYLSTNEQEFLKKVYNI